MSFPTSLVKYCLAIKLTWILFHYVCAPADESDILLNGSSAGTKNTTINLVNSLTHKSNFSKLEYFLTLVYSTPGVCYKTDVTVNSKEMLTTKLSNSTDQLAKSLSLESTANKPITSEPYFQEETDAVINNPEKLELSESSAHSVDSHTDPEENPKDDFEDIESQIDEENRLLNGKDFTESESKESIHQSDRNNVVHDESHGFHHCVLTNTKDLRKAIELMQNRRTEDNCVRLHVRAIPKLLRPECRSQVTADAQFSGQYLPSYLEAIGLQPSIYSAGSSDDEKRSFRQDASPKHDYRW
ncbi:unnamed protein product [Schistosoma turkestanicum]|nr:unnamed protein product [Schistosoma turkestanicum]